LKITEENGAMTVWLIGEIDHHSARRIREKADTELYKKRPKTLVLDFSGVTFMDSSGVGLVIGRYKTARALGCGTAVRAVRPRERRILELSGLQHLIEFLD
jgi:stage II sporulation protein AA (anti-sigma F factor antagonist)